jgi:hypothetical protein
LNLGRLTGLIYRSSRLAGVPRNYIHFMDRPPLLASNAGGTQLFIVGGKYRVTERGIEG